MNRSGKLQNGRLLPASWHSGTKSNCIVTTFDPIFEHTSGSIFIGSSSHTHCCAYSSVPGLAWQKTDDLELSPSVSVQSVLGPHKVSPLPVQPPPKFTLSCHSTFSIFSLPPPRSSSPPGALRLHPSPFFCHQPRPSLLASSPLRMACPLPSGGRSRATPRVVRPRCHHGRAR